jgi:GT2 family glycosyltransferase
MTRRDFPNSVDPLVSVVIVTYGNWDWVERTLHALLDHTAADYEVVVVDNASPDQTVQRLTSTFGGITLVENSENRGFGTATNQGATRAVGKYLCLLNSDALVQPGWLDPMIELLEQAPTVAVVVPMLLNRDGSLQEAGGAVGREGGVLVIGHDDDPDAQEYRFRRQVDYGSGACMVLRRRVFHAVGGFDVGYGLGYFEDVDLCFTLEAAGQSVVYEPSARIVHAGGVSSDEEGKQQLFEQNHRRFVARWAPQLVGRVPFVRSDYYDHRLLAARDRECLDRMLVVASDPASGRATISALLAALPGWWPSIRVTVALLDSDESLDGWNVEPGVEVAAGKDWPAWFAERRFHYSVVVASGDPVRTQIVYDVEATQPQAIRVVAVGAGSPTPDDLEWSEAVIDVSAPAGTIAEGLAELGITPTRWRVA